MRFLLSLLLLLLFPGLAREFWHALSALARREYWPLGAGFAAGVALEQALLRRVPGLEVLEHELTHAIAALLCFRRVTKFRVTLRRGGFVEHRGGFGGRLADDFIGLAPYFLPTFSVLLAAVRPLAGPRWFPWFDLALGATLGFHAWSAVRETRENWNKGTVTAAGLRSKTDIGARGYGYALLYISTATLAIHGLIFRMIAAGYRGAPLWGRHLWRWLRADAATVCAQGARLFEWLRGLL